MNYPSNSLDSKELESLDRDTLILTTRRILAEAQALSVRISAVNEIATAINRSLNLDEILRVIGKQSKWLLDFEHLSVCLLKPEGKQFIQLSGRTKVIFDESLLLEDHPLNKTLVTGQSQLIRQAETEQFLSQFNSQIFLPLESSQQIFGVIIFATTQPLAYTQEDLRIAYLLALQLSSAIRNANSFQRLNDLYSELDKEKNKSEELLLNILPIQIAEELKVTGRVKPVYHEVASIMFTDFENFSTIAPSMDPEEMVSELDYCFSYFDRIIERYHLEKLKTIGDGYMCGGGIPKPSCTHAMDIVLAALQIQKFMELRKKHKQKQGKPYWGIRIGIHSGSLLSGVIGKKKFVYDVWGNTVNLAARMESSGVAGQINLSQATYDLVKDSFEAEHRGKIWAKNIGKVDMYLLKGVKV